MGQNTPHIQIGADVTPSTIEGLTQQLLADRMAQRLALEAEYEETFAYVRAYLESYYSRNNEFSAAIMAAAEIVRRAFSRRGDTTNVVDRHLDYSARKYADRLRIHKLRPNGYVGPQVDFTQTLTLCAHYGDYLRFSEAAAQSKATLIARFAPDDQYYAQFLKSLRHYGMNISYGLAQAKVALLAGKSVMVFVDSTKFQQEVKANILVPFGGLQIKLSRRTVDLVNFAATLGRPVQSIDGVSIEVSPAEGPNLTMEKISDRVIVRFVSGDEAKWDRLKYLPRMVPSETLPA
jgi:hypothetical protein